MSFSGRPAGGDYWGRLINRNASTGFLTTRFPGVIIKSGETNTNYSDSFFKERFHAAKHTGYGLLGDVAAITTIPFFIPAGNGRLKACLSFKRDGIAIQPKGPANFHYVAIDLKIKF